MHLAAHRATRQVVQADWRATRFMRGSITRTHADVAGIDIVRHGHMRDGNSPSLLRRPEEQIDSRFLSVSYQR